jgi:hypothetical protein
MILDKVLPTAPTGKLMSWLTVISVILVIAFIADSYLGKGNLFGLIKKKTATPTPTA